MSVLGIGCKDKSPSPVTDTSTTAVNSWVYEVMTDAYFWYNKMPAQSTLDGNLAPADYFEKLIYNRTTVDRFSAITDDIDALKNEFNGISEIFGIGYYIAPVSEANTNVAFFLNNVVKGSPADLAGLKRGDVIMKINNTQLTKTNYTSLLSGTGAIMFTKGSYINGVLTAETNAVSLTRAQVTEDPVAFSKVIDKPAQNKKIGYLVYTQFVPGTTADEKKYDNELRQIFADFKSQQVNELVIDLRFNSGGYISSATTLASLVGKGISSSKVFYTEQWNDKYTAYWKQKNGENSLNYNFQSEGNNIGSNLSRVFVLTSQGTASASELLINGLKPYMEVVTIGDHTAGKNLFGSLIEDDKERWKWGLYVMLGQTANSVGESNYGTVDGMAPTYKVDDTVVPFKAFADENETLFRKALDIMGVPVSTTVRTTPSVRVTPISKYSFRDNLYVPESRMIKVFPKK